MRILSNAFRFPNSLPQAGSHTGAAPTAGSVPLGHGRTGRSSPLELLEALQAWREMEENVPRNAVRWPAEAVPLKVFIHPHPAAGDLSGELFTVLRQWEAAGQGMIRFRNVSDLPAMAREADIVVAWQENATVGRDFEVGHTRREVRGNRWITHATITLLVEPIIDRHLSPARQRERLCTTILHEMGHALGLEHSEHAQDVMHHRGWKNRMLSENDARRLQMLYETGMLPGNC